MTSETSTETGHGPPYLKEDGHGPPRPQPVRLLASDDGQEFGLACKLVPVDIEGGKKSVTSSGAVGETPLELDLLTAMSGKNEEILRLRHNMQLLQGKIKGYQTLGHLFQESKQECSRYKQKYDQLSLELQTILNRLPAAQRQELEQVVSGLSTAAQHQATAPSSSMQTSGGNYPSGLPGRPITDNSGGTHLLSMSLDLNSDQFNTEQLERGKLQLNLKLYSPPLESACESESREGAGAREGSTAQGVDDLTGSKKREQKLSDHSSASSPSFVQISGSPDRSDVQNELLNFHRTATDVNPASSKDASVASSCSSSADNEWSADIRNLCEHLSDPTFPQESKSFAADLIRISVKAIKVEKNVRVKQSLLDQTSVELDTERRINAELQKEHQALQERYVKIWEILRKTTVRVGESGSGADSMEWVEVQQQGEGEGREDDACKEPLVTAEPVNERNQRLQMNSFVKTIQELTGTNSRLEDMNRQQEQDSAKQIATLKKEIGGVGKELLDEREERRKLEERYAELSASKARLERELESYLSSPQLEPAYCLKSSDQPAIVSASATDSELHAQIQMLAQQVTVFKEDFDQERRDREAAKNETEIHKQRANELDQRLNQATLELHRITHELAVARNDNEDLKIHLKQAQDRLDLVQKQTRYPAVSQPQQQQPAMATTHYQQVQQLQLAQEQQMREHYQRHQQEQQQQLQQQQQLHLQQYQQQARQQQQQLIEQPQQLQSGIRQLPLNPMWRPIITQSSVRTVSIGGPQRVAAIQSVSPSRSPRHSAYSGAEQNWTCLTCTYVNSGPGPKCEICLSSRDSNIRGGNPRVYSIGGSGRVAGTPTYQHDAPVDRQLSTNSSDGGDIQIDSPRNN